MSEPVVAPLDLLARIEDEGHVDGRRRDGAGQVEKDGQAPLHVHGPESGQGVAVDAVAVVGEGGNRVEVTGEQQTTGPAERGAGHHGVAEAVDREMTGVGAVGTPRGRREPFPRGSTEGCRPARPSGRGGRSPDGDGSSRRELVLAQDGLELRLVVALPGVEALDHQHAGQEELPTGVLAATGGADGHAPRRDRPPADLLTGLGVDDRDRRVEDGPLAENRTLARRAPPG